MRRGFFVSVGLKASVMVFLLGVVPGGVAACGRGDASGSVGIDSGSSAQGAVQPTGKLSSELPPDAGSVAIQDPATVCTGSSDGTGCTTDLQSLDWWVARAKAKKWSAFIMHPTAIVESKRTYTPSEGYSYDFVDVSVKATIDMGFAPPTLLGDLTVLFTKAGCYEPQFTTAFKGTKETVRTLCYDGYDKTALVIQQSYLVFTQDVGGEPAKVYSVVDGAIDAKQAKSAAPVTEADLKAAFSK